jgi:mannose-1-phosphate guanylyltransferase
MEESGPLELPAAGASEAELKAFLLAAGVGERLRPLTDSVPKCLVPIQGTPLLGIWLQWCEMYGIDQVLINTHAHSELVGDFLAAYDGPVKITMTYEPVLLGSAGTLQLNRGYVDKETEFAVLYADVLTNCRFDQILDFHRLRRSPVTVATYRVPNPAQCGIISTDPLGKVLEFIEKPEKPTSDTAFTGILIAGPALLEQLPTSAPADIGFNVLPKLVGKMYAIAAAGYVLDIGTLNKYEQAQREWPGLISALST